MFLPDTNTRTLQLQKLAKAGYHQHTIYEAEVHANTNAITLPSWVAALKSCARTLAMLYPEQHGKHLFRKKNDAVVFKNRATALRVRDALTITQHKQDPIMYRIVAKNKVEWRIHALYLHPTRKIEIELGYL